MRCPACGVRLMPNRYGTLQIDLCRRCGGVWFDPGELLEVIDFLAGGNSSFHNGPPEPTVGNRMSDPPRSCPRCKTFMGHFTYADSDIVLDRCAACGGIWTDGEEVDQILRHRREEEPPPSLAGNIEVKLRELGILVGVRKALHKSARLWWVIIPMLCSSFPLTDEEETKNPKRFAPFMTGYLIALNLLMFLYQFVHEIMYGRDLASSLGVIPTQIVVGEGYLTLLTSMFVHANVWHLAGNMLFLWIFGDNVEEKLGHGRFLLLYLLAGIAGGLTSVVFYPGSTTPSIGASGAISGVMGAYLLFFPLRPIKILVFMSAIVTVPAFLYLAGWIVVQLALTVIFRLLGAQIGVAWEAHAGGFIAGAILALCAWLSLPRRTRKELATR